MLHGVPQPERHPSDSVMPGTPTPPTDPMDLPAVEVRFEQLSAYVDGELAAPQAKQIEAWLASDAEARQIYNQLRMLQASFDRLPSPSQSQQDLEALIAGVLQEVERPIWRRSWQGLTPQLVPILGKLAVGLVAVIGTGVMGWQWLHPEPLVSLDDSPVSVNLLASTRVAERYLLQPVDSRDPYAILFVEEPSY
ncbi:MAG: hypothetical protein NW237_13415 [Cyanobacteriota bacterium]|nr:hypothetical protein [Cyanobacteriota bacterium]